MNPEVVIVSLVPEEHELVSPERRNQLCLRHDLANQLLLSTETGRFIAGPDPVKHGIGLDSLQTIK